MMQTTWCVMPVLNGLQMALDALGDCLQQTIPTKVLIINQGAEEGTRAVLEQASAADPERVLLWSHQPTLPSLAATWNRALRFVWEVGGEEALVINHDVRLHPRTVELLLGVVGHTRALFVSAVGVTPEQFDPAAVIDDRWFTPPDAQGWGQPISPGGPDFSCILITRDGHQRYPFDEGFVPAYAEDIDLHRRMMLAGEGARIFSVPVPFLHYRSSTLGAMTPTQRSAVERAISQGSRVHYAKKWGGAVNAETYRIPFDPTSKVDDGSATTPALQAAEQEKQEASHA